MGVVQSDILLREAIKVGIQQMRANPELIDDMLEELLDDSLSRDMYGDKTIEQCKTWFTNSSIKCKFGLQVAQTDLPCIAIALSPSTEAESTLSDVDWDDVSEVNPRDSTQRRARFGLEANETYSIAIFVHSEPEYALFLHSILLYSLLRVKNQYLSQRGFIVSTFQIGALTSADTDMEQIYTRTINLTGKVRHTWYEDWQDDITEVTTNMVPSIPVGTTIVNDVADINELDDLDMLSGVH